MPQPLAMQFSPWSSPDAIQGEQEVAALASRALGSGGPVWLPVWALRWTHDRIHSRMIFGQGLHKDASIYELLHDLVSSRTSVKDIPPLAVVVDRGRLFSLSNRRLAALQMFQAVRRNEVIRVRCYVHTPDDDVAGPKYKEAPDASLEERRCVVAEEAFRAA
mmetsp:Transcript_123973/g.347153  ORF Transcript_123973/g.347153 Transcript_123973/m.347153 type:complete len:162 (-) Transcript_123973:540-1025(-)